MLDYSEIFAIIDKYHLQFIPIVPKKKEPLIPWKIYQTEKINSEDFKSKYFREKNNIAILGGPLSNNLVVVDVDDYTFASIIIKYLPETLTIRTTKGIHFYFFGTETVNKKRFEFYRNDKLVFGIDIQGNGSYVLAPPSIHPSGEPYTFYNNTSIETVDYTVIEDILFKKTEEFDFKRKEITKEKKEENINEFTPTNIYWTALEKFLPSLEEMIGFSGQGPHPLHGSTNGKNLIVNGDNTWYCFRHDTKGSKLHWFAIEHNIINCSEANNISPNQWHQIANKIKEIYLK